MALPIRLRLLVGRLIIHEHGGQLASVKRQFPHIQNWLDISTGISPWNYDCNINISDLQALPDEDLVQKCETNAARYFGVDSALAGNGAQAFIRHLPYIAKQILGMPPVIFTARQTYNEYAKAAEDADFATAIFDKGSDLPDGAVVILGNPNNPDGVKISPAEALQISQKLTKGLLVIDEAFCDLRLEDSISGLGLANVIVLKSFGKFFGLAGLRLGFAIADKSILDLFAKSFGVWSVSSTALLIAEKAYADSAWIESQRIRILRQAEKLESILKAKTEIICNQGLFITCRSDKDLFTKLAEQGIYIRSFTNYKDIYRFGLPADDKALQKLQVGLDSL